MTARAAVEVVSCAVCERAGAALCTRCAPVVDAVERLKRRRPFVVVGPSAFPPHERKVLSGDEAVWTARMRAAELHDAGYRDLVVEDEKTGQAWPIPNPSAVTA